MSNGQMNIVSTATAMPFITREAPAATATTVGAPQKDSAFAGLLDGAQAVAQKETATEPDKTEQLQIEVGKNSDILDVTLQLALAAYMQLGITAGDSKLTSLPVDMQQNATMATELPLVITDPVTPVADMQQNATMAAEQSAIITDPKALLLTDMQQNATMAAVKSAMMTDPKALSAADMRQNATMAAVQPVIMADPKALLLTDMQQNATMAAEQPVIITDQKALSVADIRQNAAIVIEPPAIMTDPKALPVVGMQQQPEDNQAKSESVKVTAAPTTVVSESAKVTAAPTTVVSESAKVTAAPTIVVSTALPVDGLQNVAMDTPPVTAQMQQPEAKQPAEGFAQPAKTESVKVKVTAVPQTITASEQLSGNRLQNVAMAGAIAVSPDPSAELESGVQQAEPHPTAAVTATAVYTDKTFTETLSLRQRLAVDPQVEKAVDLSNVKVSAATLQMDAAGDTSVLDQDNSNSSNNTQGESGAAYDNPDTAQNMSGQPVVEQQKTSAVTTRQAATEPLRQDVAEQVMPQVKERLDQHEFKPGKQQITLTLSPESLGELKMNMILQGGKLSVEIVTENRSVRDAIMQHVDTLKETLARQNITMESFDISTGGKGSANQGQNQNAWSELMRQQQQQKQQFWTSSRGYAIAQADTPTELAMQQRRQGESGLDIHY